MNTTQFLLNFADKIEQKEIVNQSTAIKIRSYIRKLEDSTPIELFLIVSGIMGALFCAAGIFSLIGHNWDDYSKTVRGVLSILPAIIALYFYYRAIFHHPKSRPWIEASSVFLMLMIGASIALVSQTYQLDGDFTKFIKVWAVLTIPLFYFARASGITILYLGLISVLVVDLSFGWFGIPNVRESENSMWYWYLLLGYLPHYYFALKKKSRLQSIRIVYMSYVVYLSLFLAMMVTVKGNYFLWIATTSAAFYLLGKRFMGENSHIFARPFQLFSQSWISILLIALSNKDSINMILGNDSFVHMFQLSDSNSLYREMNSELSSERLFYFVLLMMVMVGLYIVYFLFKKHFKDVSKLVLFTPLFLFFVMILHEYLLPVWMVVFLVNAYVLLLGLNALTTGSENKNVAQMVYGFLLISVLLWLRYFDTDWNFILKGLVFIGIGGVFFLINLTQKGKLERIIRNKTRRDDY
ncbi:MAG: DUF2157 domain-containing protein [Flavobacteriales bacterium]|nr:DUF2157 domain-containing protein [Flavobacteriales bacterium]